MKKKLFIIIPLLIVGITFFFVWRYYNFEDSTTTLTVTEKRWIEENKSTAIDFEIVNDYPLYGINGEGVLFDFINQFQKDIGIEFNQISYLKTSNPKTDSYRIQILDNDKKLTKKDLPIFEDYYIAIGKKYQRFNDINDMKNITFGVFETDLEDINYYLKSGTNLSYKSYTSIEDLYKALEKNEVNMIIVPNIMYLEKTIENNKYSINYYFIEMKKQVVLTLSDDNEELNKIVKKYYTKWKNTSYVDNYNESYLNYYFDENKVGDKTKAELESKVYKYGYVENTPYEKEVNNKVSGIAGEYIDRVSRLGNISFEYIQYESKKELEEAIKKGEIDIYFDYYNLENDKYLQTISTFIEEYVVIGKQTDNHIVNSLESLKNQEIAMLKGDSLYNYFKTNSKAKITTYDSLEELSKEAGNKLIVIDREKYNYYLNTYFEEDILLYTDAMMNDYRFMIKDDNKAFYDLFNYIINTNSYLKYKNTGINSLNDSILEDTTFEQFLTIVLIIIFVPLIIIVIIFAFIKRKNRIKKVKSVDRHKYTDILTSLKNRNYLTAKIPEWEESKVLPQAIVMLDLNNVKYINDNYGHEDGDQLIIKAAATLVNTQLENSEIIRTDGNEFLIYLVGYSQRQVATYTQKLNKEMKSLPHQFGAAVGYSIIEDKIKTIDDAINEATLEMITAKEEYK